MSLFQFAQIYERAYLSAVQKMKDKSGVIELKNRNGLMKKRGISERFPYPPIVHGPDIDPVKNTEQFYYSHLMMHVPWLNENTLIGDSTTYEAQYNAMKGLFPDLHASVQKALEHRYMKEKTKKEVDEEILKEESDPKKEHDGEVSQDVPTGSDMFEVVRKNTAIQTEEQLAEVIKNFSPDQSDLYNKMTENVLHVAMHIRDPPTCSCNDLQPLTIFISGNPGCGKSFLVKALMGFAFVQSEVLKNPVHFLLGGPTGISAVNIGGQTLHTIWSLPVENQRSSSYGPLPGSVRSRMRANYYHSCGHIIDEISMVSNKMLLHLNLRMMEVFDSTSPFAGLPMFVFGDMFQLQPVKADPPYVPLKEWQVAKITKGAACSLNLWELFGYEELTVNHRQQGKENALWRGILNHMRLGMLSEDDIKHLISRLIDVSHCDSSEERLEAFVTKFLECEEQGLNPLCLFPKRSMCKEFNQAVMRRKSEKPVAITAVDEYCCSKKKKKKVQEKVSKMDADERDTAGLPRTLVLARHSRVMYLVNDSTSPGMVNGARGTIQDIIFERDRKTVKKILVKFDDIEDVQTIERLDRMFQVFPGCIVHRKQFGLVLAYAVTIHKSQSLTLRCVFADIGDEIFCEAQSYVATSRCKTLEGLYLLNFNPKKVVASRRACINHARMKNLTSFRYNKGPKITGTERLWYTTSAFQKATTVTAEDIKGEKKKRPQKGSAKKPRVPRTAPSRNSQKSTYVRPPGADSKKQKDTTGSTNPEAPNSFKVPSSTGTAPTVSPASSSSKQPKLSKATPTGAKPSFKPSKPPDSPTTSRKFPPSSAFPKGKVSQKAIAIPRFIVITDETGSCVNRIYDEALACPGAASILVGLTPESMATTYETLIRPYSQRQSDDFMNRLATELHPDPYGRADCNPRQKWLSSDLMNIFGMHLCDLSRSTHGPSVYHVGPLARYLYRSMPRSAYIQQYIQSTHREKQYSQFMDEDYEHSIVAALEFAGDPLDKEVIIMFCNDDNNHWYVLILDRRPNKMCVLHYDSQTRDRSSHRNTEVWERRVKERCSFMIKFINDLRSYIQRSYNSLNWDARALKEADFSARFIDNESNEQKNGFDCGVYSMMNAESYIRNWDHTTFNQHIMPVFRIKYINELHAFAMMSDFPLM